MARRLRLAAAILAVFAAAPGFVLAGSDVPVGSAEGLASQQIDQKIEYTANATDASHPKGWFSPNICVGGFCVHSNQEIGNGRGLAVITTKQGFQHLRRMDDVLTAEGIKSKTSDALSPGPDGVGIVANSQLKRGASLMDWTPVLLVHKGVLDDLGPKGQDRLLTAAVDLLPAPTRQKFLAQGSTKDGKLLPIKDIINTFVRPWEVSFNAELIDPKIEREVHLASYPEVSFTHDCRPNTIFRIDPVTFVHKTIAARKLAPGEELTISVIDPLLPRAERQARMKKWRGKTCGCPACTGRGDLAALAKSDARMAEILELKGHLDDATQHERGGPTSVKQVKRFIELWELEGLHSRLAEGYWCAALGYNSLGYDRRAAKYASLAAQAALVEWGADSNDAIAMRILAQSPTEHYSYRRALKKSK